MRKVYHITKNSDGNWQGKLEGGKKASTTAETKAEVIQKTRELAKNQEQAQIIVHGKNGKIQTEWTYGDDPASSPG